jgi:hypothetical protein
MRSRDERDDVEELETGKQNEFRYDHKQTISIDAMTVRLREPDTAEVWPALDFVTRRGLIRIRMPIQLLCQLEKELENSSL